MKNSSTSRKKHIKIPLKKLSKGKVSHLSKPFMFNLFAAKRLASRLGSMDMFDKSLIDSQEGSLASSPKKLEFSSAQKPTKGFKAKILDKADIPKFYASPMKPNRQTEISFLPSIQNMSVHNNISINEVANFTHSDLKINHNRSFSLMKKYLKMKERSKSRVKNLQKTECIQPIIPHQ